MVVSLVVAGCSLRIKKFVAEFKEEESIIFQTPEPAPQPNPKG
jgi:hypothetical protein